MLKVALVGLVLSVSSFANAGLIELDEGNLYSANYNSGMGTGRGIGFEVNDNFHMSELGIDLNVTSAAISALYEFEIFSSTDGHTSGSLLDSINFNLTKGIGWVDFAFDFDFQAGSFYVVNFSRVDNAILSGLGTKYSWEPSSHFNYGILSTVEGFEGSTPNNSNPLSTHFRMETESTSVPEPSTLAIFALGIMGLASRRFKKQ